MINTTGVVIGTEAHKAYVHISRNTACENCGACHFDEKTMNMKITAVNKIGATVGDRVELTMDNVNFFRASFFLYGIPLLALLFGIFTSFYGLKALDVAYYDIFSILIGTAVMAVAYIFIKLNSGKFAENERYMSIITAVLHHGEFPVI
ncbi:MAG: SoxR reducing system RseC family protein [Clostridia bacterium]|nr:SoxR reducing system RseC family protein [Clostridia bacterium]